MGRKAPTPPPYKPGDKVVRPEPPPIPPKRGPIPREDPRDEQFYCHDLLIQDLTVERFTSKKEDSVKFQLAKLYRRGTFFGYGIAVNGELLDCQAITEIKTEPNEIAKVVAVFNLTAEHAENQITIDLSND